MRFKDIKMFTFLKRSFKMRKFIKVRLGNKTQKFDEAALRAMPRSAQIAIAVALKIPLHRGVSKNGIVSLILAE